jgi:hypothetical protein
LEQANLQQSISILVLLEQAKPKQEVNFLESARSDKKLTVGASKPSAIDIQLGLIGAGRTQARSQPFGIRLLG